MQKIEGPLGIWPFPILNTIIAITNNSNSEDSSESNFDFKEINIERNEQGKVENVEILKGLNNE